MEQSSAGLRKRQQIGKANQAMFLAIAGASVVVGVCLVAALFLGQRILFGEKVLAEKAKTESTLQKNLSVVDSLKNNIRVLSTDEALQSVKLNESDSALQVVLDALPADVNSTGLASSLQLKILGTVSGVSIDSLKVDPVSGIETNSSSTSSSDSSEYGSGKIGFSFTVSAGTGDVESLKQVLLNIERSIRPLNVTSLNIESQGSRIVMSVSGSGYYELAQTVKLQDKVVKQ